MVHRRRVADRLADVSEKVVQGVGDGVDDRGLPFAGDDDGSAAVRQQVARQRLDPRLGDRRVGPTRERLEARVQPGRQRSGERLHVQRPQRQPFVGKRALMDHQERHNREQEQG